VTAAQKISPKQFAWELAPATDPYMHWRVRRSTLYAFIGSLVIHGLALFVVPRQPVGGIEASPTGRDRLVVNLKPPASPPGAKSVPPALAESRPEPPPPVRRPKESPAPVVALNKSRERSQPPPSVPVLPAVPPRPAADVPTDMQSYVEAQRARRQAAEGFSGRAPTQFPAPPAAGLEPSEDEIRLARVKRNLTVGTSGIFQIISIESNRAAFSFRGWTSDASNSRREYVQVEIGNNSSIELAIVRKMIEMIRRHYQGNFNWESQRLDRTVVLSARPGDNDGLEAFLLREFFGEAPRDNRFR
jgi:hypothetical protein